MNILKKTVIIILIFSSNNLFSLMQSEEKDVEKKAPYLTFIDSESRTIILENEPKRIISLAPSVTETVFALDSGDKLIGRTEYCDYPKEVENIQTIGTLYDPNIEKIVELNPDLIIASTHFKKEVLIKFEELSLNVIIINENNTIEGVYDNINKIAQILNKNNLAAELNKSIKLRINNAKELVEDLEKPSVYYVISYGEYGDYTAGGDTFISQLIESAGGNNIAKDSMGWSYSLEKIIEKNPDIIICSKYFNTKDGLINATGYKDLPSILNGNIFTIDNNLVDRQGPRIADALEAFVNIIHKGNL